MKARADARKLDGEAQAHLRRSVVRALRDGMKQTAAARRFAVSLRAVNKWAALDRTGGILALKSKRRGRRAGDGRLNAMQAAHIRALIMARPPDQLKLPFHLWTRAAVTSLIEREFGIAVSLTTVGRYLKNWGLTSQKPAWREHERTSASIARWRIAQYPVLLGDAKRERAAIYWAEEFGLRSKPVARNGHARSGRRPRVRAIGQKFEYGMISATTNRGALSFMVFQGKFRSAVFIEFVERLLRQVEGKAYLIVDSHSVHLSAAAKRFVADNSRCLRLVRLPGGSQMNRQKLPGQDVKTNASDNVRPAKMTAMTATVRNHPRATVTL